MAANAIPPANLTESTRLTFRVDRERGWIEWAIALALTFLLFWEAHHLHSLVWLIFGVLAAASITLGLSASGPMELVVTSCELQVSSNPGRMFRSDTSIKTADVKAIEYQLGGEDTPSGLYAKHGRHHTCLLKDLTEEQANRILDQILSKFPQIGTNDPDPHCLLFGSASGT